MFLDTRVMDFLVPFHVNFEEVNLRFYVRRETEGEVRRGVVFIKEIVPRFAIASRRPDAIWRALRALGNVEFSR